MQRFGREAKDLPKPKIPCPVSPCISVFKYLPIKIFPAATALLLFEISILQNIFLHVYMFHQA